MEHFTQDTLYVFVSGYTSGINPIKIIWYTVFILFTCLATNYIDVPALPHYTREDSYTRLIVNNLYEYEILFCRHCGAYKLSMLWGQ